MKYKMSREALVTFVLAVANAKCEQRFGEPLRHEELTALRLGLKEHLAKGGAVTIDNVEKQVIEKHGLSANSALQN